MHSSHACYGKIQCKTTSVPIWHPVPVSRVQVKSIPTITPSGIVPNSRSCFNSRVIYNLKLKKIHTDSLLAADNDGQFKQTGNLESSTKIAPIKHNLFISNSEWKLNRNWPRKVDFVRDIKKIHFELSHGRKRKSIKNYDRAIKLTMNEPQFS